MDTNSDNFNTSETPTSWEELIQSFTSNHLEKLEETFKTNGSSLNKEDFFNAFTNITQLDCPQHILTLFDLINKNNEIKITWTDFLNFLIQNMSKETTNYLSLYLNTIVPVPQTRRETVVKIVLIETEKYFCYAMVSKHGRVGLYDGNLNFLTTYQLIMTREDIHGREEDRRRRNRWVTDAVFCADVLMFIVTNTARSVVIYEASGLKHVPMWLILSTPNIIQSFSYKSSDDGGTTESILYAGDDGGFIFTFVFLQPKVLLLRKKHNDKMSLFYWDELKEEKEFIVVKRLGQAHQESVKKLIFFDDNETLISCSKDQNASLVIKYVGNKSSSYIFKIPKGCNCFALSRKLKILISGSQDGVLRLWNPIITSKPIGILTGHKAALVDVKIMNKQNLFISCSSDGMLNLWDIKEQKCVQSFVINFPSFTVFGKSIEWGCECIYPGPKREDTTVNLWERSPILVTCCNHVAVVRIEQQQSLESQVLSPPPLQNSVLVPKMWKTSDSIDIPINDQKEAEIDNAVVEARIKELEFILKKDLFADNEFCRSDINFKIATLETKKLQMQQNVARGAPYLALDLHEVNDICLSPDLPVPNKKKIKNLVQKIEQVLQDATCRDLIFSEPSSSRSPRSSRSSVVEFDY